jgi:hypothetical protein
VVLKLFKEGPSRSSLSVLFKFFCYRRIQVPKNLHYPPIGLPVAFRSALAFGFNVFRQEKRNDWGDFTMSIFEQGDVEEVPEQKLWRAVIASTVQEWVSGPLRTKREAETFLFGNSQDFRTVCFSAGINPDNFRVRLQKYK